MSKRHACLLALGCLGVAALPARGTQATAAPPAPSQAAPADVASASASVSASAAAAAATPVPAGQASAGQESERAPATVVVTGRRPGPGVWKISKGAHVMWVFGTYSPLPDKLEWDASRVERLVARSQEVLLPPVAKAHIGFFSGLTALPGLIGIKKNPDGEVLHDVLPADVYAHWTALKDKYIGADDGIEHYRPIFAGEALLHAGLKRNGLSLGGEVLGTIEDIAKKNKVKLSDSGFDVTLDDPRKLVKEFKRSQVDDVACLRQTLDTLDVDLETMRLRANAWADGNIAEIRSLNYAERQDTCLDAVLNSSFTKDAAAFKQLRERLRSAWLKAAEKSLSSNQSTFAVLEMRDIAGPKGYLAALQAKGYAVESPK